MVADTELANSFAYGAEEAIIIICFCLRWMISEQNFSEGHYVIMSTWVEAFCVILYPSKKKVHLTHLRLT